MLFLEDESDDGYNNLLKQIIEIDNDDELYLKKVNLQHVNVKYWNDNYTYEILGQKIDKVLQ